jgi:hypothetical protein
VKRIEPEARLVHGFSRRIAGEWGGWLWKCAAAAVGVEPPARFRGERGLPSGLEILVASSGPADFIASVRKTRGEAGLEERLLYSNTLKRVVFAWEIGEMPADLFAKLREEAVKAVEDRKAWEARRRKPEAEPDVWEMPPWGVRLRKAKADDLARALAIRGTVVEEVLPGGSPLGLERGDLIVDYDGIYDIVMGGTEFWNPRRLLEGKTAGNRLRVIRGARCITLEVPGK